MSGHSHWAGIKHKKGIEDAKRAKSFTKLARVIVIAAREKGPNPDMNPGLRLAIEKAKAGNMPNDNIDRAIKRGAGGDETEALAGFLYEAFAPGGAAVLIEGITDNTNRSLGEVRKIINEHGGRLAEQGSVQWMFDRKGYLVVTAGDQPSGTVAEELELKFIDAGADDFRTNEEGFVVYTAPDQVMAVKKKLEDSGIAVSSNGFEYVPKNPAPLDEQGKVKLEQFFEALDDNDDVQEIYTNA